MYYQHLNYIPVQRFPYNTRNSLKLVITVSTAATYIHCGIELFFQNVVHKCHTQLM